MQVQVPASLVRRSAAFLFSSTGEASDAVLLQRSECGTWATLTLNEPKTHNSLSSNIINGIYEHLGNLEKSNTVPRAIFLRAAGGKTFCAGGDLKAMRASGGKTREENSADALHLSGVFAALRNFPRPVVALVDGPCFGGGVGVISACDMAFATERSEFALSEVTLGLTPATISPFVIDRMGSPASGRYMLTAERFGSAEAHRVGLLHGVEADADGLAAREAALKTALGRCSPQALAATKTLIATVAHRPLGDGLRRETVEVLADVRESTDGQEGMLAFIEKRKPAWFKAA